MSVKKILSMLLTVLICLPLVPVYAVSAADSDAVVMGPYSLESGMVLGGLADTLEGTGKDAYIRFTALKGTYANNQLVVSYAPVDFALPDYPYVKLEYRTDSNSPIIDTTARSTAGESWGASHPACSGDGKWHTLTININDLNMGGGAAPAGDTSTSLWLKPFGAQNITLSNDKYFDLRYIACFKTKAAADAFTFKGEEGYPETDKTKLEGFVYESVDKAYIDELNAKTEARIAEILSSETNVVIKGTKYYVNALGSDLNDGKTPESAWRTIERVNAADLKPGDGVLFKRGDKFRTAVSLMTKEGVTYSAYGEGEKPVFVCSLDAHGDGMWLETEYKDIYLYRDAIPQSENIGTIVFDGGKAWGIQVQKKRDGSRLPIGRVFNGIESFDTSNGRLDTPAALNNNLEFYEEWDSGKLYLHCNGGNPSEVFESIELVNAGHGISGNGNNVVIDNIAIFGTGSHGIGYGTCRSLTVKNCAFYFIGGSIQQMYLGGADYGVRYGNAVEIYGGCDGYTIENCYATQVYDCCWTVQYMASTDMNKITIRNNVSEFANTGTEVWIGDGGSITDMEVSGNITRYNGYGWSHQRPNKDANFFYGGNNVGVTYKNNNVTGNVNYFTSRNALLVCATGKDMYNFHDNTYVMESDKFVGGVATNIITGAGGFKSVPYTYSELGRLYVNGFEQGSKFYCTEPSLLGDMYDLDARSYDVSDSVLDVSKVFSDVADGFWGKSGITYAYVNNLFAGVSPTSFAPDSKMTRAMLVTVLARFADYDKSERMATLPYADVKSDAWYALPVSWAYRRGIIANGESFRPDEPATREELADMLYRLAGYMYKKLETSDKTFTDSADVTPEYKDAIGFAAASGVIGGYTDGSIKPKNSATRAEVATMIGRFADYVARADYAGSSPDKTLAFTELKSPYFTKSNMVESASEGCLGLKVVPGEYRFGKEIMFVVSPKATVEEYPTVSIKYRTNIDGSALTLTMRSSLGNSYLKETPKLYNDGKWHTLVIDMREMTEGAGRAPHGDDTVKLVFHPLGTELDVKDDKYFNIESITFGAGLPED